MDAGTVVVQVKHFNNAYYITGSRTWLLDVVDSTDEFDYDISNKSWPSNILNRNQEQHGAVADVQFADPTGFDLRLKPTSPAIDRPDRSIYYSAFVARNTYRYRFTSVAGAATFGFRAQRQCGKKALTLFVDEGFLIGLRGQVALSFLICFSLFPLIS